MNNPMKSLKKNGINFFQYQKIKCFFIGAALMFFSANIFAATEQTAPTVLPFLINATDNVSVQVTIPEGFIPIVGQDKVPEALKHGLVEYIPKADQNLAKWTALFTIIPLSNSEIQAHVFRDKILGDLKTKTKNFTMLNSAFKNQPDYQVATAIARYNLNGRTEILYFYAISGPVNSVSIQYVKAISADADLTQLLSELGAFFNKHVAIINPHPNTPPQSEGGR